MTDIPGIERYRRTLSLQQKSFAPSLIRALGGGASQFTDGQRDTLAVISLQV
jgi:hypothetical protein